MDAPERDRRTELVGEQRVEPGTHTLEHPAVAGAVGEQGGPTRHVDLEHRRAGDEREGTERVDHMANHVDERALCGGQARGELAALVQALGHQVHPDAVPAQVGLDTSHQLVERHRLGDVVVRAGAETVDAVVEAGPAGDHDDRERGHARHAAQGGEHLHAVELGHATVEQHQVHLGGPDHSQRRLAIGRFDRSVSPPPEAERHETAQVVVVIDDKDDRPLGFAHDSSRLCRRDGQRYGATDRCDAMRAYTYAPWRSVVVVSD